MRLLRKDEASFENEVELAIASGVVLDRKSQLANVLIGRGSVVSEGKKRHGFAFHRELVTAIRYREGKKTMKNPKIRSKIQAVVW